MHRRQARLQLLVVLTALLAGIGIVWVVKVHRSDHPISAPAITPTPIRQIPIGIADPDLINESATTQRAQLSAMKSIGITSVRVDADWRWVQPTNSTTFDWTKLDQEVRSISQAGLSADLIIDGCPPWAAPPKFASLPFAQPKSPAQYAAWAAEVAARYTPEGVHYYEIWNEPNILRFWSPKPNPAAYTADLIAASAAIRKVNHSAFILAGGLGPANTNGLDYNPRDFLSEMYADGARGSFDAVSIHPYSYPAVPDQYEANSAWSQMDQTLPSIRSIMIQNDDASKQVWITEFGSQTLGGHAVSLSEQSTILSQAIAYSRKASWLGFLYVYTWQDSVTAAPVDNGFGLYNAKGHPKPALYALATALGHNLK